MAKIIKTAKLYSKPGQSISIMEEPLLQYKTMQVILGGNKLLPKAITGDADLINLSRSGVKKSSLKSLSNYLGISMDKMSSLMHSSHRNIQRKDDNELLDVYKSEQVIEVAQVVSKALDIFGSKENMQQWLHSDIIALGNKKPIDLLDTSFGIRMIYKVLGRLEHGVYS
jgi:putative toxin-antitoxin system antitoxin component (TIGR02293 family)